MAQDDMRTYTIESPFFGKLYLIPHRMDEQPVSSVIVGYVDFGDANHLHCAIWTNGEWRGRNGRKLKEQPVRWYHTEKPDGSPLLGH